MKSITFKEYLEIRGLRHSRIRFEPGDGYYARTPDKPDIDHFTSVSSKMSHGFYEVRLGIDDFANKDIIGYGYIITVLHVWNYPDEEITAKPWGEPIGFSITLEGWTPVLETEEYPNGQTEHLIPYNGNNVWVDKDEVQELYCKL